MNGGEKWKWALNRAVNSVLLAEALVLSSDAGYKYFCHFCPFRLERWLQSPVFLFVFNKKSYWTCVALLSSPSCQCQCDVRENSQSSCQETAMNNSSGASNEACQNSLSTVQFHCLDPQAYLNRGRGMPPRPFQSSLLSARSASTNTPKSCLFALKIISPWPVFWAAWQNLCSGDISVCCSSETSKGFWQFLMPFISVQCLFWKGKQKLWCVWRAFQGKKRHPSRHKQIDTCKATCC